MNSDKWMAAQTEIPDVLLMQQDPQDKEIEIDLMALMFHLLEKAKWIAAASLLGFAVALAVTMFMITPKYEATSKLYVLQTDSAIDLSTINMGDKLAADYVQVFKNWHVHNSVIEKLNLPYTCDELESMISIKVPAGTRIIGVTVTSTSAQEAKQIADAYAELAPIFIETRMATSRPSVFEQARVPEEPASPSKVRNAAIGFLLGFAASAAGFVVQFIVDDRIRTSEMLQKRLGLPTLGMMPVQEAAPASRGRRKGKEAKA